MQYPKLTPLTKTDIEMNNTHKQRKSINDDILKINEVLQSGEEKGIKDIYMFIDGKYGAYIPQWDKGVYGYVINFGFNYEYLDLPSLIHNLKLMQAKLEGFAMGFEKPGKHAYSPSNNVNVNVTNTNEINVSISFEEARQKIEDMTSLTEKETEEILAKIAELEEIINSKDKKKAKREKAKSFLVWLADKSFDVGVALLPLLLKIQG